MKPNRLVLILSVVCVLALVVALFLLQYRASLVCMIFPIFGAVSLYRERGKNEENSKLNHKLNVIAFIVSICIFLASIVFNAMVLH